MLSFFSKKQLFFILFFGFFCCFLISNISAMAPVAIYHDPAIFYDPCGVNPFYLVREEPDHFRFDISPYYGHASGAKNASGEKVPLGDRLGRTFMIGLLHGRGAAPGGSLDSTPVLKSAYDQINAVSPYMLDDSFTISASGYDLGMYSIPVKNEKFGMRGGLKFNLGSGFYGKINSGFTHYRMDPTFYDQTSSSTFSPDEEELIQNVLMAPAKLEAIAKEIGLDISAQSETAFEDSYVELGWFGKFGMDDQNGKTVVRVMPHFAVGGWIPTGSEKNENKLFSIPTGNNGHFGFAFEGSLSFDFPETIQINVGGGATFFDRKFRRVVRVPSAPTQSCVNIDSGRSQSGIYPWTAPVSRRLGAVWHLFAGFMADHFLDKLSFYGNYVYTKKESDSIRMRDTADRNALFNPHQLEDDSMWESQVFHVGFDYDITDDLVFGGALQAPITGKRIARTLTLMGNVRFRF